MRHCKKAYRPCQIEKDMKTVMEKERVHDKAWCTLRAKSAANNRNMTAKQQRTGTNILFLRYLFAISFLLCTPL